MDPDEEGGVAAGILVEPGFERLEDLFGPAFGVGRFERRVGLEVVVIDVESAVQAEAGVDGERGREGGRLVAAALEDLGQGRRPRAEGVGSVVVDAVGVRIFAGHDRGVGRQGQGDLAVSLAEPDSAIGQDVQVGRPARGIAIAAEPVGPGRVQGDQDHVQPGAAEDRNGLGPRGKEYGRRAAQERDSGQAEQQPLAPPSGRFSSGRSGLISGRGLAARRPSGGNE